MKTKSILILAAGLFLYSLSEAQKALPIQVYGLLSKVPMPQSSEANYHSCTVETDNSNGAVSVKDAGTTVNDLETTMEKDVKDLANSSMSSSYASNSAPSIPSAEQIAQMQQQAQQMRGMTPDQARQMSQQMPHQNASQPAGNVSLMQELGKAQTAMMQINTTITELSTKVSQLGGEYKQKIDKVQQSASCPEFKVPTADIAEPKCNCVKTRLLDYRQKRVSIEDEYIQRVNGLLNTYLPKIKDQIAIIDKAEQDLKYGDAITLPAFKTQAVSVQQQAITTIAPILGIVKNVIKDSGTEYAGVVNANNSALLPPCQ